MILSEALAVLGISAKESRDMGAVRAAFSRAVRQCHPDTGATANPERIKKLTLAKNILLKNIDLPCPACGDRGMLQTVSGWRKCRACNKEP